MLIMMQFAAKIIFGIQRVREWKQWNIRLPQVQDSAVYKKNATLLFLFTFSFMSQAIRRRLVGACKLRR